MRLNKITRVLISVTDKAGIAAFAKGLADFNVEILSTGGTAAQIRNCGLKVTDVSDYTGFPEMMDGRLKTLHPRVHGGLLAIRGEPAHQAAMIANGIAPIDLLIVNLYPFEETVDQGGASGFGPAEGVFGGLFLRSLGHAPPGRQDQEQHPGSLPRTRLATEPDDVAHCVVCPRPRAAQLRKENSSPSRARRRESCGQR